MPDNEEIIDPVETQAVEIPDHLVDVDDTFTIVKEKLDGDGYLVIEIDIDGRKIDVRNPDSPDRAGVLDTCARTAKEVRFNKRPKQL